MLYESQLLDPRNAGLTGMRLEVEFDKYILSGINEGLTITEIMHFVDWDDACSWAASVTTAVGVPYVILEMTNLQTGEKEQF